MTPRLLTVAAVSLIAATAVPAAHASCIPTTPAEQRAQADVIFDGVALEGPTATGVQRFRVTRYLKARGPSIVRVNTGTTKRADGISITSVSILVRRGERWRIFGEGSPRKIVRTSLCAGSRKL